MIALFLTGTGVIHPTTKIDNPNCAEDPNLQCAGCDSSFGLGMGGNLGDLLPDTFEATCPMCGKTETYQNPHPGCDRPVAESNLTISASQM